MCKLPNFEEDLLTHHLNGADTGDINNSHTFAKEITEHIVSVINEKMSEYIFKTLEATQNKRPVGLVADKITPNK